MRKKQKKGVFSTFYEVLRNIPKRENELIAGVALFLISVFLSLSPFGFAGYVGDFFYNSIYWLFGILYWFLVLTLFFYSAIFISNVKIEKKYKLLSGITILYISSAALLHTSVKDGAGGVLGEKFFDLLFSAFDFFTYVLLPSMFLIGLFITGVINLRSIWKWIMNREREEDDSEEIVEEDYEGEHIEDDIEEEEEEEIDEEEYEEENNEEENEIDSDEDVSVEGGEENEGEEEEFEPYVQPSINLLNKEQGKSGAGDTKSKADAIKRTLQNFRIDVEIEEVTVGPTVTRYSARPAEGVKLSKILGLQTNLELALAAHPIRIEAPIPGKSLVGIEVPNSARAVVGLKTLISSETFEKTQNELPVVIGKTITGSVFVRSVEKMPHILIAGTTGSGKSVLVHNLVLSLLYEYGPEDLRMIMVDPKRVELTAYEGIPHLATDPITDPKKALQALNWTVNEMERRYEMLQNHKARDIKSYSNLREKNPSKYPNMPYIVVVIDELADLMQTFPREIETAIVRIAQKSRAVGIHLIIATQRPSVNVITGLVKANIPVRIALQVTSQIDSRTILDMSGAENLIGSGDLLFTSADAKKPIRVQSAFVTENEVKKVVQDIKKNNGSSLDLIDFSNTKSSTGQTNDNEDDDELYEEAKEIVISAKKASTSLLQRKLKIGYSRAARLMDILEEKGVVGPQIGSKPREILEE